MIKFEIKTIYKYLDLQLFLKVNKLGLIIVYKKSWISDQQNITNIMADR